MESAWKELSVRALNALSRIEIEAPERRPLTSLPAGIAADVLTHNFSDTCFDYIQGCGAGTRAEIREWCARHKVLVIGIHPAEFFERGSVRARVEIFNPEQALAAAARQLREEKKKLEQQQRRVDEAKTRVAALRAAGNEMRRLLATEDAAELVEV
jgi:hypothetical protein